MNQNTLCKSDKRRNMNPLSAVLSLRNKRKLSVLYECGSVSQLTNKPYEEKHYCGKPIRGSGDS